jgi:N-acetyl-anhydromuramoyl-L-alanine amidase
MRWLASPNFGPRPEGVEPRLLVIHSISLPPGQYGGQSEWQGRTNCNDYSIGIELEGQEGDTFEPAQYQALADLCQDLARRYPIAHVVGHENVAPGRKLDPGPGFDWALLEQLTGWPAERFAPGVV